MIPSPLTFLASVKPSPRPFQNPFAPPPNPSSEILSPSLRLLIHLCLTLPPSPHPYRNQLYAAVVEEIAELSTDQVSVSFVRQPKAQIQFFRSVSEKTDADLNLELDPAQARALGLAHTDQRYPGLI